MLQKTITRLLNPRQKLALKSKVNDTKQRIIRTWLGYDGPRLTRRLREFGIGDAAPLLVHANFEPATGFRGAALDLVSALIDVVGERGNRLMVSIPFRGAAYDYLSQNKVFNARKTISMMGLVTELFRR